MPVPPALPSSAPQSPGAGATPSASPMLTPQKPQGQQQVGRVKVLIAIHALQTAIPELGVMSEDGKSVLDAIRTLTKQFGKSEDADKALMPAEIAQIMQRAGPGAAPAKPAAPAAAAPAAPPMAA